MNVSYKSESTGIFCNDVKKYWLKLDCWTLRDAAILLNKENPDEFWVIYAGESGEAYLENVIKMATASIQAGKLAVIKQEKPPHECNDYYDCLVSRDDFIQWAKGKGFSCTHLEGLAPIAEAQCAAPKPENPAITSPSKQVRSHEHIVWLRDEWIKLGKPDNATFWKHLKDNQATIEEIDEIKKDTIHWASGKKTGKGTFRNRLAEFRNPKFHA